MAMYSKVMFKVKQVSQNFLVTEVLTYFKIVGGDCRFRFGDFLGNFQRGYGILTGCKE